MIKIKISKNSLKIFFYGYLLFAICYLLTGCVTVPTREASPTYNINGITYISLVSLCDLRGINFDYDTFTRTATLSKDAHKINVMVGDALIVVDGRPQNLKHPIDIYQGTVVVPYKFKEQILDNLFKEAYPPRKRVLPLVKIKKVVIDAGHGGQDPGAIGRTGLREKDVTLDITKRLAKLLKTEGIEVIMTRSTDRTVSLSTRVGTANNSKADLFISIHANANRVRSLNGFEVYYVSPLVNDSQRALSSAQSQALDLDKACFAGSSLDLKAILWDMIYTYNRAEAVELGRYICRTIEGNLNNRILGIKGAPFYVLKGVRTPGVLIEVGFLSNYNEERLIRNSYYRQRIAEGIAGGIQDYIQDSTLMEIAKQ